jgi:mannose-1-phosphate guanylyltransferase
MGVLVTLLSLWYMYLYVILFARCSEVRFWPVSWGQLPKLFLMLQATASRIALPIPLSHISVVTAASLQVQTM